MADIDAILLSHGHYDHGNGLKEILALSSEVEVFAHPEVFIPIVFIETDQGLVVLLACTYAGVINTLEYIKEVTEGKEIHAIIGGIHLINASQERIKETINYLAELNFGLLVPLHCTGFEDVKAMIEKFKDKVDLYYGK